MLAPAIRFTAAKSPKQPRGFIRLLCYVQPGVATEREGVIAVAPEIISVRVAAQARDGEANKAVRELIAKVLGVPRSDVEIAKGAASRTKTVLVRNIIFKGSPEDEAERIKIILKNTMAT
ncbi:DUF167-domain-containing protein [Cenococcum geophilum 1.58]|uniref:DUF167-domain-containing protein n=1 Tax=Cenococcum geophilum 1.58 TaxID=794803 RepID=UPI00358F1307|nr:DUF167-domain-containing protein [Cenococcum geophilum 1.58]